MSHDTRAKLCPPLVPLDRYAAEKGLAKRVAHKLRGILAQLPDPPTGTPCHDWPTRDQLPTTDPDE